MRLLFAFVMGIAAWLPGLAFAEEEVMRSSYRGIASLYYTIMWGILCYGLYDAFGKKALYVGAPILALGIYLLLPSS